MEMVLEPSDASAATIWPPRNRPEIARIFDVMYIITSLTDGVDNEATI